MVMSILREQLPAVIAISEMVWVPVKLGKLIVGEADLEKRKPSK